MKSRRGLGFVTVDAKARDLSFEKMLPAGNKAPVLLALRAKLSGARAEARAYRGSIERASDLAK